MKAKERLTLMVGVSVDGDKVPLATPVCFKYELDKNEKPTIAYKDQQNAWFTKKITEWWIVNVFWPHHTKKRGNVWAILLLDNCSAHHGLDDGILPDKLIIIFFPPNLTNRHQPCDMGIIAAIKVGYRLILLRTMLAIFDEENGYEKVAQLRSTRRPGCRASITEANRRYLMQ
jgi:hypothetical protein